MDKNKMKHAFAKIEVPKEEVFKAIDRGLENTSNAPTMKKKGLLWIAAAVALIGMTITSGFIHPTIHNALANAPFIGDIFKEFEDLRGIKLANENLVKNLNESLTRNGVTVKLTSAYFDGTVISITGEVNGDLEKGRNEPGEVSFDVNFEHHKGDMDPWLGGTKDFRKHDDGYMFQWVFTYPYRTIKEDYTLPITIHSINGIKGEWNFDVPIQQQKYQKYMVNKDFSYEEDGVKIGIQEIIVAKTSSSMVIETSTKDKEKPINISKVLDNKGNQYNISADTEFSETEDGEGMSKLWRGSTRRLADGITSLTFYPIQSFQEPEIRQLLNQPSFTLKSKYSDVQLKVNKVQKQGNQLILDYQFTGLPQKLSNHRLHLFENNLSYELSLIDQAYLEQINPKNPVPPEHHSISRNKVSVIDAETAHFQSVFDLDGEERIENFNLDKTVLQFRFNTFIETKTKKLELITVDLMK